MPPSHASLLPAPADPAASLVGLRRLAWVCVLGQFWVAVVCLAGSILLSDSADFTVFSGVLACLACLTPVGYAAYRRQFSLLFSCISIFNLAPIWFLYLEVILPGHDAYEYSRPLFKMEALFWAATFQLFANLAYLLLWQRLTTASIRSFRFLGEINLSASVYALAALVAFTGPLLFFYFYYGSGAILWKALTAGRAEGGSGGGLLVQESVGNASSYLLPLNWLWQLTPLFGVIALTLSPTKWRPLPVLAMSAGLLVIFDYFLGGSRSIFMYVAAPALFFLFYYNWDKGLKFWLPAGGLLFLIIGVMEIQVRFRSNLLEVLANPTQAAYERGLSSATTFDPTESHRDNNMYLFCLMVQGYPDRYPYEGLNNFFATLVNPIPRAIWPGKPILNGANDLSHQSLFILDGPLFMGTTSLTYSIVGEAYQAGGVWTLIIYAITYALFMLSLDGIVYYANQRYVLAVGILGVGVFLTFWGYRSFFALISFVYPLLLLLALLYLIKKLKIA